MDIDNFIQYLDDYVQRLNKDLEPYYQRVYDYIERGNNGYGQATPQDKVLLSYLESAAHLKEKAKKSQTFEQLKDNLTSQEKVENDYDLSMQLSIFNDYINKVHEINDLNSNRRK